MNSTSDTPRTILICDDDASIAELATIILQEQGFQVKAVNRGEKVLEIVEQEPIHLILIDLWMPGMNGEVVTKTLKSSVKTAHIPIIIMSASKDTTTIAGQVGANDALPKPFDIWQLEDLIAKYFREA